MSFREKPAQRPIPQRRVYASLVSSGGGPDFRPTKPISATSTSNTICSLPVAFHRTASGSGCRNWSQLTHSWYVPHIGERYQICL